MKWLFALLLSCGIGLAAIPIPVGFFASDTNVYAALIVSEPTNTTILTNTTAHFYVTASGTTPITYEWFTNDVAVASSDTAHLQLANVPIEFSNSTVFCIVTNLGGADTSAVVTLTVTNGVEAAAWTPETPTNTLVQWLKADALGYANEALIPIWTNSAGLDATNAEEATQPRFYTNVQNTKPVVRFDGTNDWLRSANFAVSNAIPYTIALSFSFKGKDGEVVMFCDNSASEQLTFEAFGGNFRIAAPTALNIGATNYSWHLLLLTMNGAATTYQWETNAPVTVNPGASGMQGMSMGGIPTIPGYTAPVDFGETIIWAGPLNDADKISVIDYLNTRWAAY